MITLQHQPEIEAQLAAQASAEGEELSSYVQKLLISSMPNTLPPQRTQAEQARIIRAFESIRELRKGNTLNGMTTGN